MNPLDALAPVGLLAGVGALIGALRFGRTPKDEGVVEPPGRPGQSPLATSLPESNVSSGISDHPRGSERRATASDLEVTDLEATDVEATEPDVSSRDTRSHEEDGGEKERGAESD